MRPQGAASAAPAAAEPPRSALLLTREALVVEAQGGGFGAPSSVAFLVTGAGRLGPGGRALSSFPSDCTRHPFARGRRQGLAPGSGVPLDRGRVVGGLRAGRYTVRLRVRPARGTPPPPADVVPPADALPNL